MSASPRTRPQAGGVPGYPLADVTAQTLGRERRPTVGDFRESCPFRSPLVVSCDPDGRPCRMRCFSFLMGDVSAHRSWGRWGGSRADIIRMVDLAANSIHQHTGVEPRVQIEVSDKSDLTESGGVEVLRGFHDSDLRTVTHVGLILDIDYSKWSAARDEGNVRGTKPQDRVSIRIRKWGTSLDVSGTNRDQVRGLTDRLAHEIGHGAGSRWAQLVFIVTTVIVVNGTSFGLQYSLGRSLSRGVDIGVAVAAVLCVFGAQALALLWLFPGIELRPDGMSSRWERARKWAYGAVGGLALAMVASFFYGAISGH
jgi:hypothetical protein